MFSVSCGSVFLIIPFTCGHTRARLPSYLACLSTPVLHPLLSSMTSPDAVAGATAVRDVRLAMPASASAEAAESEVLVSEPASAVGQGPSQVRRPVRVCGEHRTDDDVGKMTRGLLRVDSSVIGQPADADILEIGDVASMQRDFERLNTFVKGNLSLAPGMA